MRKINIAPQNVLPVIAIVASFARVIVWIVG